ncbi:hypothetical protein [Saccharopolyspora phatthalungensis]|uniref:Uncharacterized protein n=1 Tax=Saccharopolyspora phatthalungensis TaxID=664693 RepID=A0A840QCP5_9PSEU|nr:hypothetical protein [Saccharopolyspora phatthalungensis]MBB5157621.1 hypothetical protein [Saccharopolyspora phatthalungensis]
MPVKLNVDGTETRDRLEESLRPHAGAQRRRADLIAFTTAVLHRHAPLFE